MGCSEGSVEGLVDVDTLGDEEKEGTDVETVVGLVVGDTVGNSVGD